MCWSNHQAVRGHRPRETARPQPVQRADVRVSDAERHDVIAQLSRHTGDGRLTLEEFEQRVEEALNARTRGDLDSTLRGLPTAPVRPARRRDLRAAYRAMAPVLLVVLAVVVAGPWVLWFAVPMVMCRLGGRRRPSWHGHEVEPARSDHDELTLV